MYHNDGLTFCSSIGHIVRVDSCSVDGQFESTRLESMLLYFLGCLSSYSLPTIQDVTY
jgi:hypothetical protein